MNLSSPLLFLALIPLYLLSVGCSEETFVQLEPLERELLVVWIAAERNDLTVLQSENARAQQSWQKAQKKYAAMPLSPAETDALQVTDRWMSRVDASVKEGKPEQVKEELMRLHHKLRELRAPFYDGHPADYVYVFHEQWMWVEQISHDQMMCLVEWSEYEDAYRFAKGSWSQFRSTAMQQPNVLFPGLHANAAEAEFTGVEVDRELDRFEILLSTGNHTLTTTTTEEVRRRFFDHLAILVGYPSSQTPL